MTFSLHAALYNDYADEDIPDGDLSNADIPDTVPAEEQAASPLPTAISPPDEAGSPSPGPSQACPLPRKPARFGRRSPPPVNATQIMTDCAWRVVSGWLLCGCFNFIRGCGHGFVRYGLEGSQ